MSETNNVNPGWMVPVEHEEEPLQEGHPDWRPWSGGHASPLEAMWQWMTRQGVGGLKDPEAVRRAKEDEARRAQEAVRREQEEAQQQAQAEKDRAAKAEADRRAAEAKLAAEVRAKEAADAEAAAVHEHEEPVGFAAAEKHD